ncbi:MAG: hypothetical protein MJ252_23950 [archaeon]|nr:hypothetical protein [archaeon]
MFQDYDCKTLSLGKYAKKEEDEDDEYNDFNDNPEDDTPIEKKPNPTKSKEEKKIEKIDEETNTEINTQNESTQLNYKDLLTANEINKKYNQKELTEFLNKAFKLVNDALILRRDETMDLFDEDEEDKPLDEYSFTTLFKFSAIDSLKNQMEENIIFKDLKISDMVWSSNGNYLAVSYFFDDHIGPCSHTTFISFFKFDSFNPESKNSNINTKTYSSKIEVEFNSCIKCITAHPLINNVFVAGSFRGEIYYINIGNEKDCVEFSSTLDSCFYRECVVSIKFIKVEENMFYLVSISNEGRVLVWDPSDKLKFPIMGFNLRYPMKTPNNPIDPSAFADNPYEPFDFTIGTFDGSLFKCSFDKPTEESGRDQDFIFLEKKGVVWRSAVRTLISNMKEKEIRDLKTLMENYCKDNGVVNLDLEQFFKYRPDVNLIYKNALRGKYERHFSFVTSLNYNYYIKNLVLTTSYDGSFRLYNIDGNGAKYFYSQYAELNSKEKDDYTYYTTSSWSPYRPSLFAYGDNKGKINFSLIKTKNTIRNILSFNNNGYNNAVVKILFNGCEGYFNKNIVAIIYEDGIIELINLSENFQTVANGEIENLYKIIRK